MTLGDLFLFRMFICQDCVQLRHQVADLSMRVFMLEEAVRQLQERASLEQKSRDWVNFACFRCHKKESDGTFYFYFYLFSSSLSNHLKQGHLAKECTVPGS